jgi:hypothetical protein
MNSDHCRERAQECRELAGLVPFGEPRAQLLRMARAWETFAYEADRTANAKKSTSPK